MLDQVTHERLREEAQDIKRCLPKAKQDVDETVLCELLMSLPSEIKNRREHIIGIITGKNYNVEEESDEEGSVNNESQDNVQNDIEKDISNFDIQHFTTRNSVETIDVSDTEDDRDYYYNSSNYDDISILNMNPVTSDTITDMSSSSSSDAVLDEDKTVSNNKSKTSVNVDHDITEIKRLRENNNNESLKENNNDVVYMKSVFYEKNSFSDSPKPGCSKDSDDGSRSLKEYCSSCNFDDLQIDANRIHTLLPNIDYSLIYKTLCNNQLAKNHIELTLWDLLPKERPSPQLANKRKRMLHKIRPLKIKRNSSIIQHKVFEEKTLTDTRTALEKEEQIRNEMEAVDIQPQKNRESVSLTNETEEMKMDTTESDYTIATNNTDDNTNNPQINMALEVKVNQLDTLSNDVNMFEDVHLEKSSENYSKNKELQSTMNLTVLHKTEVDDIHSITLSTAMPSIVIPSITASNIADSNIVASSIASPMLNTAASSSADSSTIALSTADPYTAGPSTAGAYTAGPSTAGPYTAGPSTAGPYTAGPSTAGPYTAGPSTAGPYTAGPSTADPYTAGPSTVDPRIVSSIVDLNTFDLNLYTADLSNADLDLYTAGPSTADLDLYTAGPSTADLDLYTAGPSIADLYTTGPTTADLYTVGPSTADLYTAGPSTADLYTAGPSIADPYAAGPSTAGSSIAASNIAMSSTADPSTAVLKMQTIDALRTVMPILRPTKFTVVKGTPVSSLSSKQASPILTPSKLQHLTTLKINHAKNVVSTLKNKLDDAVINKPNIYEDYERNFQTKKDYGRVMGPHGLLCPSVKVVANNTMVTPNKMQSSVKPKRVHGSFKNWDGPVMRTVPSFVQSSNLPENNTLLHSTDLRILMGSLNPDTDTGRFSAEKSNDEQKNHLRQQGDMNALQIHNTEKEKQDIVASHDKINESKKELKGTTNNTGPKEIILNEKASKIYYKLIPMFPTVNTVFIKNVCLNYLTDDKIQSHDEPTLLETLVIFLLENGQKYPNIKEAELPEANNSNITYDLNDQYADLLMIFPEADPIYLRKIAEENYKDPEKMKEFVQSKLENPDYPTRTQYLAKKKITEQQKQYTSDFKIQQFLELFSDPFAHFENANRQCKFNPHAVDFLKHYFSKIRVNTLLNTYTEHLHNLSLTAKALEVLSPDMKSKRTHNMILTEDIPLLQECAFIQHKVELRKYLTELKDEETKEFNKLKARNELVECQCCYENECMPSKCFTCEDGHLFCSNCIVRSTELILAEGKAHINCLLDCGNEFPLSILQKVLSPTKFSILLCKRQEAEVMAAGLEGLVSCPFCHFASIPPPEDRVFRCLNPNCMKESCRLCKELNHVPLKCNEVKSDAARLYLEEKMTEALVRKCYKCGRTFFKEEGCNKMTCLCGAQMCYICDQPVTNYKHFQGQGVQNSSLCPLWSDDRRLNAESVIKVCRETMKQIKQTNPEVDINVNALLPKLPAKMRGPHEDIAHANEMPAHAARIARYNP